MKTEIYYPKQDKTREYDLSDSRDILRYLIRHPYAWPGGYELYAITDDGGALCPNCLRNEYRTIYNADKGDGWYLVGRFGEHEMDENDFCSNCGNEIGPLDPHNVMGRANE